MSGHRPWATIPRKTKKKICKVCYKLYDPTLGWQVESHMHQGQGPADLNKQ